MNKFKASLKLSNHSLLTHTLPHTHSHIHFMCSTAGCQSINIDSHFNSSYSFIYLLIHSLISFMPKKFQVLWLKSDNWLTGAGFILNSLDTKMYSTTCRRTQFFPVSIKRKMPPSPAVCCTEALISLSLGDANVGLSLINLSKTLE